MTNYYATLEVPVGSDISVIREAYRRLVQENLWNKEIFAELKEAYEVLSTPVRRREYDQATFGQTFQSETEINSDSNGSQPDRRCPLQAGAHCPVLTAQAALPDTFCPECGYLLASLPPEGFSDISMESDPREQPHFEEPGSDRVHRLRAGISVVGREAADVLLTDKTVSRRHAQVELLPNQQIFAEDLGSTNGTRINDTLLAPHNRQMVRDGDSVRFGSVSLVLRLPVQPQSEAGPLTDFSQESEEAAAHPLFSLEKEEQNEELSSQDGTAPGQAAARARLVGERHGTLVREDPLVPGVTTFGRRPENNIVLRDDPYISGMHAQIIAEGDLFRLTDLGSTNGTYLNGARMAPNEPATLKAGDVIGLGALNYRFEPNDVPAGDQPVDDADLTGEN